MWYITSHNLKCLFNVCRSPPCRVLHISNKNSSKGETPPKVLYKYLIRQCEKLPEGPKKYYKFSIKQSFKQHANETDPERIKQIIARSYEDADWVLKKYISPKV